MTATTERLTARGALELFLHPLTALESLAADKKTVVSVRRPIRTLHVVCEPRLARIVLTDLDDCFAKGPGLRDARSVLGDGLLTGDGPKWRAQRRNVQRFFSRDAINRYQRVFEQETSALLQHWEEAQDVELVADIKRFATSVAARCFAGTAMPAGTYDLWRTSSDMAARAAGARMKFPAHPPAWFPTRNNARAARARQGVSRALSDLDPDPGSEEECLRTEELATMLVAGSETTASLLIEAFVRLGAEPSLQREIRAQMGEGRRSSYTWADGPRALESFVLETLRLSPPVWAIPRRAKRDVMSKVLRIEKGADLLVAVYAVHRWPERWNDAERFDPERFAERGSARHDGFVAFGGGPRACLGGTFAMHETLHLLERTLERFEIQVEIAGLQRAAGLTLTYKPPVRCRLTPVTARGCGG